MYHFLIVENFFFHPAQRYFRHRRSFDFGIADKAFFRKPLQDPLK